MAALAIEDLVSRKWLTTVVSVEETSAQVRRPSVSAGSANLSVTRTRVGACHEIDLNTSTHADCRS